jgi:hypothetical protein
MTAPKVAAGTDSEASSAQQITYEDIQISRHLGRGVVVDTAPEYAKAHFSILNAQHIDLRLDTGGIRIAEQVEYEITGYDPADCTLTLRLVHDWRPGQKDDPHAEPTDHLDFTPYLAVSRYQRDRGGWAWGWRCDGDGTCDGHVALDLGSRNQAEHNARRHLAAEHPADVIKEG